MNVSGTLICALWVLDIDLAIQRPDHFVVAADIPFTFWQQDRAPRPKSNKDFCIDKTMNAPPLVAWSEDVHSHAVHIHQWLQRCQPRRPRLPRKRHLQDATWGLIQGKAYHWKRVRQIRHTVRMAFLRSVFAGWRGERLASTPCFSHTWLKQSQFDLAWHLYCYKQLCPSVAQRVRQDDTDYYQRFAQSHSDESLPTVWKTLKPLLPRAAAKRANNLRCVGPATTDIVRHFDALEAGEATTYPNLLRDCHRAQQAALAEAPLVVPLTDLPSRIDIERLCCKAKKGKAPGIDQVTSETLCRHAVLASDTLHQLILKAFIQGAEPLQWKGGRDACDPEKIHCNAGRCHEGHHAPDNMWQTLPCAAAPDAHWLDHFHEGSGSVRWISWPADELRHALIADFLQFSHPGSAVIWGSVFRCESCFSLHDSRACLWWCCIVSPPV